MNPRPDPIRVESLIRGRWADERASGVSWRHNRRHRLGGTSCVADRVAASLGGLGRQPPRSRRRGRELLPRCARGRRGVHLGGVDGDASDLRMPDRRRRASLGEQGAPSRPAVLRQAPQPGNPREDSRGRRRAAAPGPPRPPRPLPRRLLQQRVHPISGRGSPLRLRGGAGGGRKPDGRAADRAVVPRRARRAHPTRVAHPLPPSTRGRAGRS